ncbi:Inosine/uridine-preferring nucleoside hydrolase [Thermaerobacter marianensis DSM 12885]|uniref:Inosine/uridine-preferring nucleoside hydrolase n=1 Tax=Thermaerobacter marianensis (strain ATCC 700841 / DSM 12885 / JCM 10246 / 7p75a) TaxID=644966 RepID=E6SM38_THEM7|nr:nucleoside hydrolase [Thermaerobacter marianensis]ADU50368.1 Inosine/uridine-preferring nucleoside hydrolase [Thermaerobacter marianensis DSM 12885]
MPVRLIIDTDTAGDDVNSLLIALLHPEIQLEAVTISVGNVGFEQQIENALYTIEMAGRSGQVPVYPGCATPLLSEWVAADYVHGRDGMGDSFFPKARQRPEPKHAVDALIERIHAAPGELTILAQAPLTNIAAAVIRDPSIAAKVKTLYIMGGTYFAPGNITPAAEYNFYVDPEAARIVFRAGFDIRLVDWGLCVRDTVLDDADLDDIRRLDTELARFYLQVNRVVRRFNETVGIRGVTHPDSIVAAMIADPAIARGWQPCQVDIETRGELTRGASVITPAEYAGVEKRVEKPNAQVCLGADKARFKALLMDILSRR